MAHNLLRAARVKERLQGFLGCLLAVEAGLGEEALLRRQLGEPEIVLGLREPASPLRARLMAS